MKFGFIPSVQPSFQNTLRFGIKKKAALTSTLALATLLGTTQSPTKAQQTPPKAKAAPTTQVKQVEKIDLKTLQKLENDWTRYEITFYYDAVPVMYESARLLKHDVNPKSKTLKLLPNKADKIAGLPRIINTYLGHVNKLHQSVQRLMDLKISRDMLFSNKPLRKDQTKAVQIFIERSIDASYGLDDVDNYRTEGRISDKLQQLESHKTFDKKRQRYTSAWIQAERTFKKALQAYAKQGKTYQSQWYPQSYFNYRFMISSPSK